MSTNTCSSTFIFSVLISLFSRFSMKVLITWWFFVPAWVVFKLWNGVLSYSFGMENLMVQFVLNEHQCMFIKFYLCSVDQYLFPWFSMKVLATWWFFVPASVILKLSKGVFSYNFCMESLMVQPVFNEHQHMFINFHLSLLISLFSWFSMKVLVTWWFFVLAWVVFKLWNLVFSYNLVWRI